MKKAFVRLLCLLLIRVQLPAQTTVWLRDSAPEAHRIISPGCSETTPIVCTLDSVAGFAEGDAIGITSVCATDGLHNVSAANGRRKIGTIVGNTISLQDTTGTVGVPDGAPIASNGPWCTGSLGDTTAGQRVGKLTAHVLNDRPRIWFDGPNGNMIHKWAFGPASGLTSVICTLGVCVVTTTFDHTCVGSGVGVCVGNLVTLWNSGSTTLTPANTGGEYTVTAATAFTFTFDTHNTAIVGNLTSNPHCGAGVSPNNLRIGTEECIRISFEAISTNPAWVGMRAFDAGNPVSSGYYKFLYQGGGGQRTDIGISVLASTYTMIFMVDQTRDDLLSACVDMLKHVEMMGGNNFIVNELLSDGGNYELAAYTNTPYMADWAIMYQIIRLYLTSGEKQTFIDKILNDIGDPTPCTVNNITPIALTTGAIPVDGTATTMTLASGASAVNDAYKDSQVEMVMSDGQHQIALITGYNGTTKVITFSAWAGGDHIPPVAGNTYSIWETSSLSGTTLTGYHTKWNTAGADHVNVGDYIISIPFFPGFVNMGAVGAYVTAVVGDTELTVIPGHEVTATTTPATSYISKPWNQAAHSCGWFNVQAHWQGDPWGQASQYPPNGGVVSDVLGGNNGYPLIYMKMAILFAIGDDDPRVDAALARVSIPAIDNLLAFAQSYWTGLTHSGTNYGFVTTAPNATRMAWMLRQTVPTMPNLDTNGPWINGASLMKMYIFRPDSPYYSNVNVGIAHYNMPHYFGSNTNNVYGRACEQCSAMYLDGGIEFNPTATISKYLADWMKRYLGLTDFFSLGGNDSIEIALKRDPRQETLDHTLQPKQYFFHLTSGVAAQAFGSTLDTAIRAYAVVSHTDWLTPSATSVFYRNSGFPVVDHDVNQPLWAEIYRSGSLLGNDHNVVGDLSEDTTKPLYTERNPFVTFGGVNTIKSLGGGSGVGTASISRWSGADEYGDPASEYACWTADAKGAYTNTLDYLVEYVCHFKQVGAEEIFVTFTVMSAPSATLMKKYLFYPENSQTTFVNGGTPGVLYNEGTTSCPGTGGCGNLNANRLILEQQSGLTANGDPAHNNNLISRFFSPGTITLTYDGDAYPNANGAANRLAINGGSTSTSTVTSARFLAVHKRATQPDTAFTAVAITPDSNWFGFNSTNAVGVFPQDASLRSSLTPVGVTLLDPGIVHITGLTAGNYHLNVGGFNCGDRTVVDGNNSITCKTTGTVSGNLTLSSIGATTNHLFPLPVPVKQ